MKLSIIVPCKNEGGNITKLHEKICSVLKNIKFETIYIDDGSNDETLNKLTELYEKDINHVKVLSFSRNFKKEAAMIAGLEYASGEYTCFIDADLQQNPKYLLEMYEILEKNSEYDVVAMYMNNRIDSSKFMKWCKNSFYRVMEKLCDLKMEDSVSDFRMFRSNVREALINMSERNRFSKGLFAWLGFNTKYMPYEVEPRDSGKTSFNFKSYLSYAFDGLTAFTYKPLKLATTLGGISVFTSFIYLLVLIILIIAFDLKMKATYMIIFLLLLLFGIQFILIGIIGKYLSLINDDVKKRPYYVLKLKLGFNEETLL